MNNSGARKPDEFNVPSWGRESFFSRLTRFLIVNSIIWVYLDNRFTGVTWHKEHSDRYMLIFLITVWRNGPQWKRKHERISISRFDREDTNGHESETEGLFWIEVSWREVIVAVDTFESVSRSTHSIQQKIHCELILSLNGLSFLPFSNHSPSQPQHQWISISKTITEFTICLCRVCIQLMKWFDTLLCLTNKNTV